MKVIKIGAVWCPGCLVMRPRWKEIEAENPWVEAQYLDYDNDREAVAVYAVDKGRLPAFIFLSKDGTELLRLTGEVPKEELLKVLNEHRNS